MNIPLNINLQQILLHLFNFAILTGGLYFLLYKPVKDFMEKRVKHFQDMEDSAKNKVAEAEALNEKYARQLQDADEEIRQKRLEAMQSIKDMSDQRMAEAQNQADAIVAEAQKTAARSRAKAIQEAHDELKELAVAATKKIVLESGDDALDQFLNAAERGTTHERAER